MASQAVLELLVQLKDQASAGLGTIGNAMGTLGGIAGGAALAGVAALGAGIIGGIGDAKEAALIMAQTESVIKSTGGAAGVSAQHIADYAASLSAASGQSLFGDSQIQESENLLLTFTNIKDKTLDAATAISVDMAQALGGAPKDAAIGLGKALNDPITGISALSKVGVTFTEEQKEQIKTMQESGNMAGAQAVILAELNKEFGGSAKAAADADGGMAKFNDSIGEAFEGVGAKLLPMLNKFADWLNSPQVQEGIAMFAEVLGTGIQVAAEWIATQLIPALIDLYNWLAPRLGPVLAFLIQALGTDVPNGVRIVIQTWNEWKAALVGFKETYIDPIIDGYNFVVTAIGNARRSFDDFMLSLGRAVIPSWLRGQSPPPLADWFDFIGESADVANTQVAGFNDTVSGASVPTNISAMQSFLGAGPGAIPAAAAPIPQPVSQGSDFLTFFGQQQQAAAAQPAVSIGNVDARGSMLTEQQIRTSIAAGIHDAGVMAFLRGRMGG